MERLHIVTYRHNFETRDFKIQRRDGNENVKKTIGFNKQNTFLYNSLPFLREYTVKMPNF